MGTLFTELRKRNVIRVAIAYCIVGWLIAQVADLAADNFGAPDWVMRMLLIILLLGLPVALFLAWAFELTPEGMKRAEEVPADAPKDPRSGRILNRIIIATLAVLVVGLAWDRVRNVDGGVQAVGNVADKSVAVLPFADFSPGGDQAWFADGLTDEILNALARTNDLRVASRTSAFAFRNSVLEIPQIAAELGVAHILEGSVRRSDDRVRVTAQLIRASDDTHLWSDTFDGTNEDAISIQENIAINIARALQTTMDPEELERMIAAGTNSVEAWELYLKAEQAWRNEETDMDAYGSEPLALLERAIEVDPAFVDAHLAIADLWAQHLSDTRMVSLGAGVSDAEARQRFDRAIRAAAELARSEAARIEALLQLASMDANLDETLALSRSLVDLRPDDADVWLGLANAQVTVGDYAAARESAVRAAELLRQSNDSEISLIQVMHRVDVAAAVEGVERELRAGRRSTGELYQLHRVLLWAGMVERAASLADDYLAADPDSSSATMVRIRQACAEGRVADADAAFAALDTTDPSSMRSQNAWLYLLTLGRNEDATETLRPYDEDGDFFALSNYLFYTSFDPALYPNFNKHLAKQGVHRPPAAIIPFACER